MPKRPRGAYMLALLSIMLLAGCGSSVATSTATPDVTPTRQPPMPTSLRIMRFAPRQANVAPFEAQTDQAEKVQQLFATLRALPPFVPRSSCPHDQGGGYLLTFMDYSDVVAQVVIPVGGCGEVQFSKPYGCHTLTVDIMDQIADTLTVQHTALIRMAAFWNSATPGGPTAPAEPSEPLLPFSPSH